MRAFSCRQVLPRYVTNTNLILFPKKKVSRTFSDLRPISLSFFLNKFISRSLYDRPVVLLPKIIYKNQAGFVKDRTIIENVLFTQEIIKGTNRRNKYTDVVVKLNTTKPYDGISWIYLTKVVRSFGFLVIIIDMV